MRETCILKLGGSILTDKKGGQPILRARAKEIAREIARARSTGAYSRLILLYGGGSFGHPLAHRYQLVNQPLSARTLIGVGRTISAMRELGTQLVELFLDVGIPAVPLQTSSFTGVRRSHLHFSDISILETILQNGGVPLLGGDVAFLGHTRTTIVSADWLAVELARTFKNARLFFATDTDGVYAAFPPRVGERPFATLTRAQIKNFLAADHPRNLGTDVTGAMPGKLRALLDLRGRTAVIFNGNIKGAFVDVLKDKKRGTQIIL